MTTNINFFLKNVSRYIEVLTIGRERAVNQLHYWPILRSKIFTIAHSCQLSPTVISPTMQPCGTCLGYIELYTKEYKMQKRFLKIS